MQSVLAFRRTLAQARGAALHAKCERFVLYGTAPSPAGDDPSRATILLRGGIKAGDSGGGSRAPFSQLPNDVFVLRWLGLGVDMDLNSTRRPSSGDSLSDLRGAKVLAAGPRPVAERMDEDCSDGATVLLHRQLT